MKLYFSPAFRLTSLLSLSTGSISCQNGIAKLRMEKITTAVNVSNAWSTYFKIDRVSKVKNPQFRPRNLQPRLISESGDYQSRITTTPSICWKGFCSCRSIRLVEVDQ